ncbi:chitin-binding type-2 domain-containing protein [Trichonephila clavipes]|nr:chitin-binding type-2 domain-containing protein [Trichonephila clavipes]
MCGRSKNRLSAAVCFSVFASLFAKGVTSSVINRQCRAGVCDDRPECPKASCRCIYPSKIDCTVYYQCVQGKPVRYRCSQGLLFNTDTLTCDYDFNVDCTLGLSTSSIDSTSTTLPTTSTTLKQQSTVKNDDETTPQSPPTSEELTTKASTSGITETNFTDNVYTSTSEEISIIPTRTTNMELPDTSNEATNSNFPEITSEKTDSEGPNTSSETTNSEFPDASSETTNSKFPDTSSETTNSEFPEITTEKTHSELPEASSEITNSKFPEITTIKTYSEFPDTSSVTSNSNFTEMTSEETPSEVPDASSKTTNSDFPEIFSEVTHSELPDTSSDTTNTKSISTLTETIEPKNPDIMTGTTDSDNLVTSTEISSTIKDVVSPTITNHTSTVYSSIATTSGKISTDSLDTTISPKKETTITSSDKSSNPFTDISSEHTLETLSTRNILPEISTTKQPSNWTCPSRFGLFPDPEDCNKYYQCSQWEPVHKTCDSGLHFNPIKMLCDWAGRAGCGE